MVLPIMLAGAGMALGREFMTPRLQEMRNQSRGRQATAALEAAGNPDDPLAQAEAFLGAGLTSATDFTQLGEDRRQAEIDTQTSLQKSRIAAAVGHERNAIIREQMALEQGVREEERAMMVQMIQQHGSEAQRRVLDNGMMTPQLVQQTYNEIAGQMFGGPPQLGPMTDTQITYADQYDLAGQAVNTIDMAIDAVRSGEALLPGQRETINRAIMSDVMPQIRAALGDKGPLTQEDIEFFGKLAGRIDGAVDQVLTLDANELQRLSDIRNRLGGLQDRSARALMASSAPDQRGLVNEAFNLQPFAPRDVFAPQAPVFSQPGVEIDQEGTAALGAPTTSTPGSSAGRRDDRPSGSSGGIFGDARAFDEMREQVRAEMVQQLSKPLGDMSRAERQRFEEAVSQETERRMNGN